MHHSDTHILHVPCDLVGPQGLDFPLIEFSKWESRKWGEKNHKTRNKESKRSFTKLSLWFQFSLEMRIQQVTDCPRNVKVPQNPASETTLTEKAAL